MIDVDFVKRLTFFILNKNQASNSFSFPDDFNDLLRQVNLEYFDNNYKRYETDIDIMDTLSSLKDAIPLTINASGQAPKPSNYLHISSLDYSFVDYDKNGVQFIHTVPVPIVSDAQKSVRVSNSITYPTKYQPFCQLFGNNFQFYPSNLGNVMFTFLRYPIAPVWGGLFNPATDEWTYIPTLLASGAATSGTAVTLTDNSQNWATNTFSGYGVFIEDLGQTLTIASNTSNTLTFSSGLIFPITVGTKYVIGSRQIEYPEIDAKNFTWYILKHIGVNLEFQMVTQYATEMINTIPQ